ncbi:MAG: hypothetical protein MJ135_03845, partial [Oscillospiraceae bacterium]|nr:hypothetical protein [Oscillospiraceae bacterium]
MTEKLYYANSHLFSFSAQVISCTETNGTWALELDRTAFFPGGGGQECDTGTIAGLRVEKVKEAGEKILHF